MIDAQAPQHRKSIIGKRVDPLGRVLGISPRRCVLGIDSTCGLLEGQYDRALALALGDWISATARQLSIGKCGLSCFRQGDKLKAAKPHIAALASNHRT
jgi:hypothetical protein